MNNLEARRILELYRPGLDDGDPQFADALALARRDPQLGRWLEEHAALHMAIRGKLKAVEVPADLQQRLLRRPPTVRRAGVWWLRPSMAAAAATVVLVALALFWARSRESVSFVAFRAEMVAFVSEDYKLDLQTESFEQVRRALIDNDYPSLASLPPAMAKLELEGGCRLHWRGHKVALICTEAAEDHDVWLFLVDRAAVPDAPLQKSLRFATLGRMATATWTQDDLVYLLVVEGDEETLRRYL